jgi:hypothetical protein
MSETLPTKNDVEHVRRLQMYFRNDPALVWMYGASDEGFINWVKDVLKVIRADDMAQVKQGLEKQP